MALPSIYPIKNPFHLNRYALLLLIVFGSYFGNENSVLYNMNYQSIAKRKKTSIVKISITEKKLKTSFKKVQNDHEKTINQSNENVSAPSDTKKNETKPRIQEESDKDGAEKPEKGKDGGRNRTRIYSSRSNQTLKGAPIRQAVNGSDPELTRIAEEYAKENGIEYNRQSDS
jgi:hypothetical protein